MYEHINLPFCEDTSKYVPIKVYGRGHFARYMKAVDRDKPSIVVTLKKVTPYFTDEEKPINSLREIRVLKRVSHQNVVQLLQLLKAPDFHDPKGTLLDYLILEFCDYALTELIFNMNLKFSLQDIKGMLQQILHGLHHIHSNKVIHGDFKTANILITRGGIIKITDFSLSHEIYYENYPIPAQQVLFWYRSPELLLGVRDCSFSADMWSFGCIMAEMWTRTPLMKGSNDTQQLIFITQICGSITSTAWPEVKNLKTYTTKAANYFTYGHNRNLKKRLLGYTKNEDACDLIDKILVLDPKKRLTTWGALSHKFLTSYPISGRLEALVSEHHRTISLFENIHPKYRPRLQVNL